MEDDNGEKEGNDMKNRKMMPWILCAALAVLFTGCAGENTAKEKDDPQTEAAAMQPEKTKKKVVYGNLNTFTADTLDGGTFNQDDLSGKDLTVVNCWSVTCGPCVAEMPDLAKLQKALPDNVQLLTVCLDGIRGGEAAQIILDGAEFTGETLIGWDGDAADVFGKLQYTPTTLFFDKDGNAVGDAIIGGQEDLEQAYLDAMNSALKEMAKEEVSLAE